MAANRMYLRCKGCGAKMMLAKLGADMDWYYTKEYEVKGRELYEFTMAHSHCCDEVDESLTDWDEWQNARPFEVVYENDDDYGRKKSLQQLTEEKEE
jgi:hypothetical protein